MPEAAVAFSCYSAIAASCGSPRSWANTPASPRAPRTTVTLLNGRRNLLLFPMTAVPGRSDSVGLPDQVGGLLSDHDASRHRVPGRDARHDRGVGDAQAVDAVDAELTVDDGHFIAAHFGRAGLMPKGGCCVSRVAFELARSQI